MADRELNSVEDFERFIGAEAVDRILSKAGRVTDLRVLNDFSTYYDGGVAELLSSLTPLMNVTGNQTGWRVIQGRPDYFSVTKEIHNALLGAGINLSQLKLQIYEDVVYETAVRNHIDHEFFVLHNPQTLTLAELIPAR